MKGVFLDVASMGDGLDLSVIESSFSQYQSYDTRNQRMSVNV